ncbi:hypothetical protein [Bosea sp. (in: a-proteobacteria)]|jgi:hypothetical protein|uniref:hypothetical protein n=1 Tax=Bosea sp. (in: a-proteobacteria) TaxID=1871050 RepID=UPI003F71711F
MPTRPTTDAMLCIWHDVEANHVEEYLRWHSFEHLPERLALPGFRFARRYELAEGPGQRFFCVVDVRALADFASPEYRARLDAPTEWTRRLMPRYGRVHRSLCRTLWTLGNGLTGLTSCVRIAGDGDPAFTEALASLCARQLASHHLASAQLGVLDAAVSGQDSEEKRLRRSEDSGGYDLALLLGGISRDALQSALDAVETLLERHRLRHETSLYALSCALGRSD